MGNIKSAATKPSDADLYGYEDVVEVSWANDDTFDTPVPSFTIRIAIDSDTDELIGDLHIKHPKEENFRWYAITIKDNNYLSLCYRLINRCYSECFINLYSKTNKNESITNKIRKILNNVGNDLLQMYGGLSGIITNDFVYTVANILMNNGRKYYLQIRSFVNEKNNSISNIYAMYFEKYNDITICKVYHYNNKTKISTGVTPKGGFCFNSDSKNTGQIFKSKLFANTDDFLEMLLKEKSSSSEEYLYFKNVIEHMVGEEEYITKCSMICYDDNAIFVQDAFGNIKGNDVKIEWADALVIDCPDSELDSEKRYSHYFNKLTTANTYHLYPLIVSSNVLNFIRMEKEYHTILDSIESNSETVSELMMDAIYGNGSINIGDL